MYNAHAQRHAALGLLHWSNRLHLHQVIASHLKIQATNNSRKHGHSCRRFMVSGFWFMVYGLWFMLYGLWFMVQDFMVYGLRFVT
jgi:hypothetical protein